MSALSMPLVQLPAQGTVGGRPRKEGVYDTEVLANNANFGTSLTLFLDFSKFKTSPVGVSFTKQSPRDTNLQGGGTRGLPKNTALFWYELRCKVRPLGVNLALAANKTVTAEILRYIQISSASFAFTQTPLIQMQLDECPAGVGPAWGATTHTDTALFGPNCVPDRKGKIVTITGKPVYIPEMQDFSFKIESPEGNFTPTVDLFVTAHLEGLLVRGLT